jgi:Zn-dependent protease
MHGINELLNWSLRLGRIFGTEVRVSWLLGVWMVFEALNFARAQQPAMMLVAFLMPLAAMIIHALGHTAGCRLAGGRLQATTLSIINNLDDIHVPLRPGAQFLAGFAGPLINLSIAGASHVGSWYASGFLASVLAYAAYLNLLIGIANLLACQPFDGQRWWRGLLWSFLPMRKAVQATLMLAFLSAILLLVFAVWRTDFMLLFIGIISVLATVNERMAVAQGQDPIFLVDPTYVGSAPPSAWRRRRAERDVAAEQEVLDRLLAKVSAHGLPALTAGERKQLQRISQQQKERDQHG